MMTIKNIIPCGCIEKEPGKKWILCKGEQNHYLKILISDDDAASIILDTIKLQRKNY